MPIENNVYFSEYLWKTKKRILWKGDLTPPCLQMEGIWKDVFESEWDLTHYLCMLTESLLGQKLEGENTSFLTTRITYQFFWEFYQINCFKAF